MDDSTSHPLETPISWDKSMLAMHDTVYRQATLIGSRTGHLRRDGNGEPHRLAAEPHPLGNSILPRQEQAMRSSNLCSMKSDHQQGLVFEHWSDGKPPAPTSGSTNTATHICGVEDCDKAFVRKSDLARHLKSHKSGSRTHNCLAEGCPRKGLKGFWRTDKFKDHMHRKHPEIEVECWYYANMCNRAGGYRDVEKREQHEALMRSKGYKTVFPYSPWFTMMSASEMAAV